MKEIRILANREELEGAYALLHDIYIEKMQWKFAPDSPSHLRVEERNGRKLLLDRFGDDAIWFGVFDGAKIVGCARIQGTDEHGLLELESYPNSHVLHSFIPRNKYKTVELAKFAILPEHISPGIIRKLFFALFEYCYKHQYNVLTCTHNNFLKNFYIKIKFPLILEHAFKYDLTDPSAVNFYCALFENNEVHETLMHLSEKQKVESSKCSKIFNALEIAASILPIPVYWHDRNSVVLGNNEHCLNGMGTSRNIIGKTPYEFYPKETADHIVKHHKTVMETGNILTQEEKINDMTTGQVKYFCAIKAPLYDDGGSIIGIVGTSIDITAEKEAERLRRENERLEIENQYQNKLIQEQRVFKEIIDQAVHDIRSPLASLLIVSSYTKNIPEEISEVISGASKRINDIANNLLQKYRPEKQGEDSTAPESKANFQVSLALQEIISEKKYEFYNLNVEFKIVINPAGYLAFLYANETAFKRMISNLLNNAVEACEKSQSSIITVYLTVSETAITVVVEDNGKGMPSHVKEKILNNIVVTEGKQDGHGIGYAQVRDTLQRNDGCLKIDSNLGQGTRVSLTFTKKDQPHWVAEILQISNDDIVVILDDDSSIHKAWELRLRDKFNRATIKFFEQGIDALNFINTLTTTQKNQTLLLADYELVQQRYDGLEIIKKAKIKRSILVTSRFSNRDLQMKLNDIQVKMLPKLYISEVPIVVV